MADLALLNAELEEIAAKRALLRQKHSGATMPEQERADDEAMADRSRTVIAQIEAEKQRIRDATFEETSRYLNDPVHTIPRAINEDDESRRALAQSGFEIQNGMVTKQTSNGTKVELFGEDVLFGPIPTGPQHADIANFFRQTRAAFQPDYRNAYLNWLRSPHRNDGAAYAALPGPLQNALSEGSDGAGGFVVPPDVQAEMLVRTAQQSVMRRLCRVVTTSRDKVVWPKIAPNADNPNIYSSGFVGSMVGETPAFTETGPAFQDFEVPIRKGRVATKLSNDWLADSVGNMLAFLSENGAENMALLEDYELLNGDGTAFHPLGLLNSEGARTLVASGGMAVDVEGSTANTISNSTSDVGSAPLIKGLAYALPSQYAENASWLMRRSIEGSVAGLVDASGRPIWNSYLESGFARPMKAIENYPVFNSEFMGTDGAVSTTAATTPLAFGDFGAYILAQRAQISTTVLRERFADNEQTGIILTERFGGALWNTGAMRFGVIAS